MTLVTDFLLAAALAASFCATPAAAQVVGKPSPRSNPQGWVKQGDYPAEAITKRMTGVVSFVLDIDETGKVTGCTLTGSSGWSLLDDATCTVFMTRGKFYPARDERGVPTRSTWRTNFHWELPARVSR